MASSTPELDPRHLQHILTCILFASTPKGRGVPAVIIGPPGAAKSAIAESFLRSVGLDPYTISPGLMGEAFFGVTPVPVTIDGQLVLTFPPPHRLFKIKDSPGAALFIDEMNAVVSSSQLPSMLGMLQDRRIGDFPMGPSCRVFAAMNPQRIAANGVRISIPQANRLSQWEWAPIDDKARAGYLRDLTASPDGQPWRLEGDAVVQHGVREELEERMDTHYRAAHAEAVAVLHSGFLGAHPARRNLMPEASSKEAVGPWPSDRSWTNAMALYAAAKILCSDSYALPKNASPTLRALRLTGAPYRDLIDSLLASCVGSETAQLYSVWSKNLDLPNVDDWFKGSAEMTTTRTGDNAVFIANIQAWMRSHASDLNKQAAFRCGDRVMDYVTWMAKNGMLDLAIVLAQDLLNSKDEIHEVYVQNPPSPAREKAVKTLRLSSADLSAIKGKVG